MHQPHVKTTLDSVMSDGSAASQKPAAHRSMYALLRRRITAGLILVIPIWLTIFLATLVFRVARDCSLWAVKLFLDSPWGEDVLVTLNVAPAAWREHGLAALPWTVGWGISLFSVCLTIGVLYLLGMLSSFYAGRKLLHLVEAVVDRLPVAKTVYRASKQVLETFSSDSASQGFQKVVIVPFPSERVMSIGFVTRTFADRVTGDPCYAVFVPTTPNPTTGFALVMRSREVIEAPWTLEDGLRILMSGGLLMPDGTTLARGDAGAEAPVATIPQPGAAQDRAPGASRTGVPDHAARQGDV